MKTGCYTHSCSRILVLLCELVTDCGSAVVQISSWDRHDFGGSLPVAWSHPTLACIKLVISTIFIIYPCSYLQSLRSDHPRVCPYHFPMNVNMINFMEKRVLVRTSQADPTREKCECVRRTQIEDDQTTGAWVGKMESESMQAVEA
jgi:hypothetical protein